jgi:AcrR family transcriptional regulator
MRYNRDQKAKSRAEILLAASRRFRADGIAASGIAGIMEDAAKTNGAFYAHFESKDDLVSEVLDEALERQKENLGHARDKDSIMEALESYLSPAHRDHPGDGCPSASLLPEISRLPKSTRMLYEKHLKEILDGLGEKMGGAASDKATAVAVFSMAVGAMQLARAVTSEDYSDLLLESVKEAAKKLIDN